MFLVLQWAANVFSHVLLYLNEVVTLQYFIYYPFVIKSTLIQW